MNNDFRRGYHKGYQQALREEVNRRINLTEFNKKFRRDLRDLYKAAVKSAEETIEEWTERVEGIEAKIKIAPEERQKLGIVMTRSWEVPHPPGIKAYDFFIDWEEIDRDLKESRLLRYVDTKRKEYLNSDAN